MEGHAHVSQGLFDLGQTFLVRFADELLLVLLLLDLAEFLSQSQHLAGGFRTLRTGGFLKLGDEFTLEALSNLAFTGCCGLCLVFRATKHGIRPIVRLGLHLGNLGLQRLDLVVLLGPTDGALDLCPLLGRWGEDHLGKHFAIPFLKTLVGLIPCGKPPCAFTARHVVGVDQRFRLTPRRLIACEKRSGCERVDAQLSKFCHDRVAPKSARIRILQQGHYASIQPTRLENSHRFRYPT